MIMNMDMNTNKNIDTEMDTDTDRLLDVPNAGMPDCPESIQSGTGLKKTNNAGTGPLSD